MGRGFRIPTYENFLNQKNYFERFKTVKEIKDYISKAVKYFYTKGVTNLELKCFENEYKEILEIYKNHDNQNGGVDGGGGSSGSNLIEINKSVEKIILSIIIKVSKVENLNLYDEYLIRFNDLIEFDTKITPSNYIEKFKTATFNFTSKTLDLKLLKEISILRNFNVKNSVNEKVGSPIVNEKPIKYEKFIEFLDVYFNQQNFVFKDEWINGLFKLVSNKFVYFTGEQEGDTSNVFKEKLTIEEELKFDYKGGQEKLKSIKDRIIFSRSEEDYESDGEEEEEDEGEVGAGNRTNIRYKIGVLNGTIKTLSLYKFLILLESMMEKSKIRLYNKFYLIETLYSLPNKNKLYLKMGQDGVQHFINLIKENIHPLEYIKFNSLPFEIESKQFVDFLIENSKFYQLTPLKISYTKKIKSDSFFQLDTKESKPNSGDEDGYLSESDDDDDEDEEETYQDTIVSLQPRLKLQLQQPQPQLQKKLKQQHNNEKDKFFLPFKEIEIIKGNNITITLNAKQQFLNFSTFEIANYFHEKLKKLQVKANNELPQSPEFDISSKEIYYLLYLKSLADCNNNEILAIENIVSQSNHPCSNKFHIFYGIGGNDRSDISKIIHPYYFRNKSYRPLKSDSPIRETKFFKDKKARRQLLNHFISSGFKCFTPSLFCYLCELILEVQQQQQKEEGNTEKEDYFKDIFSPLSCYSNQLFSLSFHVLIHFIMILKFDIVNQIIECGMSDGVGKGGNKSESEFKILSLEMIENGTKDISSSFNNKIYRYIRPINKRYTVKLDSKFKSTENTFDKLKSFLLDTLIGKGLLPPIPKKTHFFYQLYYKLILQSTNVTLKDLNHSIHPIFQERDIPLSHRDFGQYLLFYWFYIKDPRLAHFIFMGCSIHSANSFKNIFLSRIKYSGYIYFNYMFQRLFRENKSPTFEEIYSLKDLKEAYFFIRDYLFCLVVRQTTIRTFEANFILKTKDFNFFIEYLKSRNDLEIESFPISIAASLFEFIKIDQIIEFIRLTTIAPSEIQKATSDNYHDSRFLKMWYGKSEVECKNWLLHYAVLNGRLDIIKLFLVEDTSYSVLESTKVYITNPPFLVSILECLDTDILRFFISHFINETEPPEKSFFYNSLSCFIYSFPKKNQLQFNHFKFKSLISSFSIFENGFEKFDTIRELLPSFTFDSKLVDKCIADESFDVINYYYDIGVITNDTLTAQQKKQLKSNENLKYLNWVNNLTLKRPPNTSTTTTTTKKPRAVTNKQLGIKMVDIAQIVPDSTSLSDLSTPQFSVGLKTRRSLSLKNVELYKTNK